MQAQSSRCLKQCFCQQRRAASCQRTEADQSYTIRDHGQDFQGIHSTESQPAVPWPCLIVSRLLFRTSQSNHPNYLKGLNMGTGLQKTGENKICPPRHLHLLIENVSWCEQSSLFHAHGRFTVPRGLARTLPRELGRMFSDRTAKHETERLRTHGEFFNETNSKF